MLAFAGVHTYSIANKQTFLVQSRRLFRSGASIMEEPVIPFHFASDIPKPKRIMSPFVPSLEVSLHHRTLIKKALACGTQTVPGVTTFLLGQAAQGWRRQLTFFCCALPRYDNNTGGYVGGPKRGVWRRVGRTEHRESTGDQREVSWC